MSKRFVHDGKEVEATGRTALRNSTRSTKQFVLYEIKPVGLESSDASFFKWVKLEDLYIIQDNINNNNGEEDDIGG